MERSKVVLVINARARFGLNSCHDVLCCWFAVQVAWPDGQLMAEDGNP
jgi:hypothetical protein